MKYQLIIRRHELLTLISIIKSNRRAGHRKSVHNSHPSRLCKNWQRFCLCGSAAPVRKGALNSAGKGGFSVRVARQGCCVFVCIINWFRAARGAAGWLARYRQSRRGPASRRAPAWLPTPVIHPVSSHHHSSSQVLSQLHCDSTTVGRRSGARRFLKKCECVVYLRPYLISCV